MPHSRTSRRCCCGKNADGDREAILDDLRLDARTCPVRVRPSDLPPKDELGLGGLLGMALHPELLQGTNHDHVYLAHTYKAAGHLRAKIRRYTYDPGTQRLIKAV